MKRKSVAVAAALCLATSLAGCSSYQSYRKAEIAEQEKNWDQAVLHYMDAVDREPENLGYRAALLRSKIRASQEHFEKGKQFRDAGVLERAVVEFQQATQLDPTNQYAQVELDAARETLQAEAEKRDKVGTIDQMKQKTRGARPQPPVLNPRSNEPIDLEFPKPTSIKDIYLALGKAFGINVLFDPNLKDQEITLSLKSVTAQDALEVVMRAAAHFYKVQDERTIIVVADTPQNRRNYEDLVIQTFFLSNADIKQVLTMLRSLVDAKKIATNDQLNAIVLRDTADKVKVAEKIIESNDKSKAEVVVDVELLQVNSTKLQELGMELSAYSITQSLDMGGTNIPLRLSDVDDLTSNNWTLTIPNFTYNLIKNSTQSQILARPQLRITEGEKARLLIGDRVPIPTTTFNTSNTVGGNIVPLTTFQYTDVGIKIEIEPRVHHNKEITLKVTVEVSNISDFVEAAGGQRQPVIGTRTIESTIRLKDGETNFLAGLIRTEDITGETGIPGLSEIPLLGRLFSNQNSSNTRTDVILTMTPHIIRTPNITEDDLLPIWVGTEANITFRGESTRIESEVEGPFDGDDERERVQELLRQRLQRLPRGLQDDGGEVIEDAPPPEEAPVETPEEEAPPGVDLAPTSTPGSFFDEDDDGGPTASLGRPPAPGFAMPIFAVAPAHAAEASPLVHLSLAGERRRVKVGESFEVQLDIAARAGVAHLPLELEFDATLLAIEAVAAGPFLGAADEVALLSDASQAGRLILGASRLGEGSGVTGEGTVATFTFRALAAGDAAIRFGAGKALDGGLAPLAVELAPALPVTLVEGSGFEGPGGRHGEREQQQSEP